MKWNTRQGFWGSKGSSKLWSFDPAAGHKDHHQSPRQTLVGQGILDPLWWSDWLGKHLDIIWIIWIWEYGQSLLLIHLDRKSNHVWNSDKIFLHTCSLWLCSRVLVLFSVFVVFSSSSFDGTRVGGLNYHGIFNFSEWYIFHILIVTCPSFS